MADYLKVNGYNVRFDDFGDFCLATAVLTNRGICNIKTSFYNLEKFSLSFIAMLKHCYSFTDVEIGYKVHEEYQSIDVRSRSYIPTGTNKVLANIQYRKESHNEPRIRPIEFTIIYASCDGSIRIKD